jgi:hypothetical protein
MAWLPILRTVLPYIGPVVRAALPHLTRKKSDKADPVTAQQIAELQDAVSRNTESLKTLAVAMEESAKANDAAIRQARLLAIGALVVAVVALIVAIVR